MKGFSILQKLSQTVNVYHYSFKSYKQSHKKIIFTNDKKKMYFLYQGIGNCFFTILSMFFYLDNSIKLF